MRRFKRALMLTFGFVVLCVFMREMFTDDWTA
jgi:hypothetical protein